jgi:predicted SprT family Zn-dependent metalloprotease
MPATPNRGRHHNLDAILDDLRRRFFPDCAPVTICWGRWSGRARTRSIRFGAYLPEAALIRIHPALDQAFVPRLFVEFIVYHELLHHVMPPLRINGRYQIHSSAFRQREHQFPAYAEVVAWRKRSLRRLLASNGRRQV